MTADTLTRAMPDFVAFVGADGRITDHVGGAALPLLRGVKNRVGQSIRDLVEPDVAELLLRLVRRALRQRQGCGATFTADAVDYCVRVDPHAPDRAVCVIGRLGRGDDAGPDAPTGLGFSPAGDFARRFQDAITDATLREHPLAVCAIALEGLADIGRLIDYSIRAKVLAHIIERLPDTGEMAGAVQGFVGMWGDSMLGAVIRGNADRTEIRSHCESICALIGQPVTLNGTTLCLSTRAGVAILGQDASTAAALMDCAVTAMREAQRLGPGTVQFYSDTVRMLPVLRLDIERELRRAIEQDQIALNYVARHDLRSGALTGIHATICWLHPIRGVIAPTEFLGIAETTDLAATVSRAALERLIRDLPQLRAQFGDTMPVSFGPLRQHFTDDQLLGDLRRLTPTGGSLCRPLELRISERTLAALTEPAPQLRAHVDIGARWVVEAFGAGTHSVSLLASLPLCGIQIERDLVVSALSNPAALRSCRAIKALAAAYGLNTIAAGVDSDPLRACMLAIGYIEGCGNFYPALASPVTA